MRYVLDTSALMSGNDFLGGEFFTTPAAMRELRRKGISPELGMIIDTRVRITSPSKDAVREVEKRARLTGDMERLSPTDIGIVALSKELGATILTDDYSIQNMAKEMGLGYQGVLLKEIKEKIIWTYRCRGCGKFFDEPHRECPICGSELKTTRKRR